jgi:hypothetical protein
MLDTYVSAAANKMAEACRSRTDHGRGNSPLTGFEEHKNFITLGITPPLTRAHFFIIWAVIRVSFSHTCA